MKILPKGFWWSIIIAIIIYFGMILYANANSLLKSFEIFSWVYFIPVLFLSLINYNLRFLKWDYLLKTSNIKIDKISSYNIFMAGLAGTISPGKAGELIKPFLIRDMKGIPIETTVPVFFFERITDLIGLILLSVIGIFLGRNDIGSIILIVFIMVMILFFFTNPMFWKLLFGVLGWKPTKGPFYLIYEISKNIQIFWNFKVLSITLLITILSWGAECVGFFLVLKGFNIDVSNLFIWAIFIYSASTIIGAIVFIPGGLGVTEGSLSALAISIGIDKTIAISSTFIIRSATLWFAVFIGIYYLIKTQKQIDKSRVQIKNEDK